MITTLEQTTSDIGGLNSKLRRRSHLQAVNRNNWAISQAKVSAATTAVDERLENLKVTQSSIIDGLSERLDQFVRHEFQKVEESQRFFRGQGANV